MVGFILSVDFGSGTTLAFLSSEGKTFFSMHKLKTYVSESVMYGNKKISSWLLIPSRPDDFLFSSLDMYLHSSETERYGITNGSCPLVFCLQKSCRRFEHSYTFVLGSINDSDTDRKWLLKTFAVRFFGMSAEVERCPFVNTFRARHTNAILLSRSMSFWKYSFLAFLARVFTLFLNFLYSWNFFSLFSLSLSLPLFPWCLC